MQISEELLLKYTAGKCTMAECVLVENWLNTVSEEEINQFVHLFEPSRDKILKRIHDDIDENSVRNTWYHDNIIKVGIAICFAITFYGAGAFFTYYGTKVPSTEIAQMELPQETAIYISTISGKPQKISAEKYDVFFEGSVRLYIVAQTEQVVTCNGKEITLRPNKAVYLMSSPSEGFFEINDPLAFDNFSGDRTISKFYKVCVKS